MIALAADAPPGRSSNAASAREYPQFSAAFGSQGLKPSLIWIKAVGIEDDKCEKVTTCMKPSIIVWDLETVPDLGGFAAACVFSARSYEAS
jgi:hypothetical protein